MRIIHVLHSLGYGGAENHALVLMQGQMARGHNVLYAGRDNSWLYQACQKNGIPVFSLRMHGMYDIFSMMKLRRHAKQWDADIIHGHLMRGAKYAGMAGAIRGRPISVGTAHSDATHKHMGYCRHIIAVSQSVKRNLVIHKYDADKISVIYNGMPDFPNANRHKIRRELHIPDDICAVVNVGRFAVRKGQDILAQAVTKCPPQMHFYFIGNTSTPSGMHVREILKNENRVHFLEYRDDVQRLLPAFDIYALPSRVESFGLSLVEASAASLPIVAANVGGVPEVIIDGKTGLLVSPNKPDAMAQGLKQIFDDPELAQCLGQNARKRYLERFTLSEMVQKTLDLYESLLRE